MFIHCWHVNATARQQLHCQCVSCCYTDLLIASSWVSNAFTTRIESRGSFADTDCRAVDKLSTCIRHANSVSLTMTTIPQSTSDDKRSSKIGTSIYQFKFECGFEVFVIWFVTAVSVCLRIIECHWLWAWTMTGSAAGAEMKRGSCFHRQK